MKGDDYINVDVKDFVEATATSLPAFIYTPQCTAFAIAGRPFKGACKASSKGDLP